MVNPTDPPNPERREFVKKACAVCLGTAAVLVPAAAGLTVLVDPLRRKTAAGGATGTGERSELIQLDERGSRRHGTLLRGARE